MAENEFEKNVRSEMDEFKLHPSGEVWFKIEERIREKKRKRRILFFVFSSAIALMLGGYGIYHFSGSSTRADAQSELEKSDKPHEQNKTESTNGGLDKETIAIKPTIPVENLEQTKKVHSVEKQKQIVQSNKEKMITSVLKGNSIAQDQKPDVNESGKKENDTKVDNTKQESVSTSLLNAQPETRPPDQKEIPKAGNENLTLKDTAGPTLQELKDKRSLRVSNRKKGDKVSNKITWGINFSAGTSVITEDAFSFKSSAADVRYVYSPGSNTGGGPLAGGGGGPVAYYNYPQSQNKPAFAFKAGIIARRNISKRSSLSAGLDYSYLADKIKVGAGQSQGQTQSAFALSYYGGSPQQTYTDHFHFIELPLNYNWRVTKNEDHFLSLSAGVSPSWLLTTNALIYDTAFGGVYYHNKDLVTKTHFNFISGVSYQFKTKRSLEFAIGPRFSFDVTEVFKSDLDKRKYLLFTGIGATIFFEKKKK